MKSAAIAAAALLSFVVIAAAHGTSAVTPTVGYYEAHLGGNKYFTFGLYDYRFLQVDSMAIEERHPSYWVISGYDGYDLVHGGRFTFGSKRGLLFLATGEWTSSDAVRGTVTLTDGTKKDFNAVRKVTSGGGGFNLPPAADGVHPAAGHYKGPYLNGTHVLFTYHGSHVLHFQAAGHTYFGSAPVHEGSFTWRNPDHPHAHIVGHWTSAHDVVGGIFDQHGVEWEFHASLQ